MSVRKAKNFKILLNVLLVSITIFSIFKYFAALKEKHALLNHLEQAKGQIVSLEEAIEKERELENVFAQENLTLKDDLKANADKLLQLDADLQNTRKTIEQLTSQIAIAKAENTALREEKDSLALELTEASKERDALKARLSSVPELKKTIKEVKVQIHKAKVMMREITKKRRVMQGNRGYLVKNGQSTYPVTKIKIEVMPAPRTNK